MRKEWLYIIQYVVLRIFISPLLLMCKIDYIVDNITFIIYLISALFVVLLFGRELLKDIKKVTLKQLDQMSSIGVFTLLGEIFVSIVISVILKIDNKHQMLIDESSSYANPILLLITIILLAPIVEEFFYRFCIFEVLSKNKIGACLVSVFLFGFGHVWEYVVIGDLTQMYVAIPYMVVGVGLVVIYKKTNNICYPILLHILINTISQLN